MRWSSALSTQTDPSVAVGVAVETIRDQLAGESADMLLIFASGYSDEAWDVFLPALRYAYPEATILGCTAGGVIGGGREVEGQTSLSITAAHLPDVAVVGFHYDVGDERTLEEASAWWGEHLGLEAEHQPSFILIPDPFTCDPTHLMGGLDRAFPGAVKIGGLASGGDAIGDHVLVMDDQVVRAGAVGVALYGDIEVSSVVAQGCRPVGHPMVVTQAKKNFLIELSGEPALSQLEQMFSDLEDADQALFRGLPMVGLGMEKGRNTYRQGDFLIRHLMGMDRNNGVLAVGAFLEEGQVIQFHVRDADSSRADLEELLIRHARSHPVDQTEGAVLFSCLGRGERFFGEPDHDSGMATRYLGGVAIGGFFCAGEIGPVNGQTWLHGYTTAMGIFRPKGWS
jgi:small ligand-binding sensory domain FIST